MKIGMTAIGIGKAARPNTIRAVVDNAERLGFYFNFERALGLVPPEAEAVALCDQDDEWYPDKLATLLAALREGHTLVYSDQRIVGAGGEDAVLMRHALPGDERSERDDRDDQYPQEDEEGPVPHALQHVSRLPAGKGQGEADGPIGTGPVGGYAPSASCVSVPVSGGSKTLITWTSVSALTWCRSFGPTT